MISDNYTTDVLKSAELRNLNIARVYQCMRKCNESSRLLVSQNTGLSIPTVSSNMKMLEKAGFVSGAGEQKSTGGRRAQIFRFNSTARISIGVELLKDTVNVVALDLYGEIIKQDSIDCVFSDTDEYFVRFGEFISGFIKTLGVPDCNVLGVAIAIQGLVSDEHETVTYSYILGITGMKRKKFQDYIKYPCTMIHDTYCAGFAEVWSRRKYTNTVYFALNKYFGGALIPENPFKNVSSIMSSTIEHMTINPDGRDCYCGKKGCLETFCSVNNFVDKTGMKMPEFFSRINNEKDQTCIRLWDEYLSYIAIAVDNIRMIMDCDFVFGGYLVKFMTQKDLDTIYEKALKRDFRQTKPFSLSFSIYENKSPMVGAAIIQIEEYFKNFRLDA